MHDTNQRPSNAVSVWDKQQLLDEIISRSPEARKIPDGYMIRCPHGKTDANPSCHTSLGTEDRGAYNCFACDEKGNLLKLAKEMRIEVWWEPDHFGEKGTKPSPTATTIHSVGGRPVTTTYDYTDVDGKLLKQIVRQDLPDGTKTFSQRRPDNNGGWINSIEGVPPVPYNYPAVHKGIEEGATIWFVEGEKCADDLIASGLIATTTGGAKSWRPEYVPYFSGANVVIIPDNDKPGREYASGVAGDLHGIAAEVRYVSLPGVSRDGEDVYDWFRRVSGAEDLDEIAIATMIWTPPESTPRESPQVLSVSLSAVREAYGEISWAWEGWIPRGHLTMLAGTQGTGKSRLTAYLIAVFTGAVKVWPDGAPYAGPVGPVVLVDTEHMRGEYAKIFERLGVREDMIIIPSRDGDPFYVAKLPGDAEMIEDLARGRAAAIVVDSLSGGHELDENSAIMRTLLRTTSDWGARLQIPVIVDHHVYKRGQLQGPRLTLDRVRGSSTITQFARSVIGVTRLDDELTSPVRVEPLKVTFGQPHPSWGYMTTDTGITPCEPPELPRAETQTDRAIEFLRVQLQNGAKRRSELIDRAADEGISRSTIDRAKPLLRIVNKKGKWSLPVPDDALHLGGSAPEK